MSERASESESVRVTQQPPIVRTPPNVTNPTTFLIGPVQTCSDSLHHRHCPMNKRHFPSPHHIVMGSSHNHLHAESRLPNALLENDHDIMSYLSLEHEVVTVVCYINMLYSTDKTAKSILPNITIIKLYKSSRHFDHPK